MMKTEQWYITECVNEDGILVKIFVKASQGFDWNVDLLIQPGDEYTPDQNDGTLPVYDIILC